MLFLVEEILFLRFMINVEKFDFVIVQWNNLLTIAVKNFPL